MTSFRRRHYLQLVAASGASLLPGCAFISQRPDDGLVVENVDTAAHHLVVTVVKTSTEVEVVDIRDPPASPPRTIWTVTKEYAPLPAAEQTTEYGIFDTPGTYWIEVRTDQYAARRWVTTPAGANGSSVIVTVQDNERVSISNPVE